MCIRANNTPRRRDVVCAIVVTVRAHSRRTERASLAASDVGGKHRTRHKRIPDGPDRNRLCALGSIASLRHGQSHPCALRFISGQEHGELPTRERLAPSRTTQNPKPTGARRGSHHWPFGAHGFRSPRQWTLHFGTRNSLTPTWLPWRRSGLSGCHPASVITPKGESEPRRCPGSTIARRARAN